MKSGMKDVAYVGRDLEAMSFAPNYHRWILEVFSPYVGKRVAEIGAGSGNFSSLLLSRRPEIFMAAEPSSTMFEKLQTNIASGTNVCLLEGTLERWQAELESNRLDTILYINVLEHIEKDDDELKLIHRVLQPRGRVLIFVPALPFLYGTHDVAVGHCRRYTKQEITSKLLGAGFSILDFRYFDIVGILPWLLTFKILKLQVLTPGMAGSYDTVVVPILKKIEKLIRIPIGKNLLVVGQKP